MNWTEKQLNENSLSYIEALVGAIKQRNKWQKKTYK